MTQSSDQSSEQQERTRILHKLYSIPTEALDTERVRWCMEQIPKVIPPYPEQRSGRGIIICAGGRQRLLQAYAMLSYLRRELGCTLPVELIYVTDIEMQAPCIELFESELDVRCIDARALIESYPYTEPKYLRGYMIKPFALLTSSFEEVLLIDCDNIPVRDPSFLFEMDGYREHGAVFWRDFPGLRDPSGKEKIFEILDPAKTTIPKHAHETGQVVMDTRKLWASLHLVWFLNNNHELFYKVGIHGETDLYQICITMAGQSFFEMPYAPKTIGSHTQFAEGIHGHSLGQCDLEGEVLFAHRCCDDSYGVTVGALHGSDEFTTSSKRISLPIPWDWVTAEAELPGIKVDANNKWILVPKSEPRDVPESLKRCYAHVCATIEHLDAHELHRFPEDPAAKNLSKTQQQTIPANLREQSKRLEQLRSRGFECKRIVDIGACQGRWTDMVLQVFPDAKLLMVEANEAHRKELEKRGHPFDVTLLGDEDKDDVTFYLGDVASTEGCSMYREQTSYFFEEVTLPMKKLDTLIEEQGLTSEPIDLIKIDVQGAEIDVLRGATKTLESGPFVLLETQILEYNKGAPMLADVITFMHGIGYQPCDVFELHFLPNTEMLNQVDILFAPKGHAIFELPAHAESTIAPPQQTSLLAKVITALKGNAEPGAHVAVVDAPGHSVLGQYLEHGFKSQGMQVSRLNVGSPLPDCVAVYIMPGADTPELLADIAKRQLLSVTGFPTVLEAGHASLGLETQEDGQIGLTGHPTRLKAEGHVLPEALAALVRMVGS